MYKNIPKVIKTTTTISIVLWSMTLCSVYLWGLLNHHHEASLVVKEGLKIRWPVAKMRRGSNSIFL